MSAAGGSAAGDAVAEEQQPMAKVRFGPYLVDLDQHILSADLVFYQVDDDAVVIVIMYIL